MEKKNMRLRVKLMSNARVRVRVLALAWSLGCGGFRAVIISTYEVT